jgi:hypothetical protein
MDVKEILKFAHNLVFAKTGKYLDNVQKAILRGTWQDQKYAKIAEKLHRKEGHVRDIPSELWKILSEVSYYAAKPDKIALPLFWIFLSHLITISPSFNNLSSNSDNSSTD